jgi:hypothetical protein
MALKRNSPEERGAHRDVPKPVRHYLRDEAKELRLDGRPQAWKKPEAYPLEYVEDFFWTRTTQMAVDRSPRRTVNVGQIPKKEGGN